jgi:hypothetical protein
MPFPEKLREPTPGWNREARVRDYLTWSSICRINSFAIGLMPGNSSNAIPAALAGVTVALTLLTGCTRPEAPGSPIAPPVTGSDGAGLTISPRIGGPNASGSTSPSGSGVVGAGSFPRSFLIPGTDTSIRIGG